MDGRALHSRRALIAAVVIAELPLVLHGSAWTALPGLALAVWCWRGASLEATAPEDAALSIRAAWAAGVAVALLALVFRGAWLTSIPAGLYVDEVQLARNALRWRSGLASGGWFAGQPLARPDWVETPHVYLAL